MNDLPQTLLDAAAKWGPWVLGVLMLFPVVALWRLARERRTPFSKPRFGRAIKNLWWLATLGIGVWVMEVKLAPLTGSLVTLQEERGEKVPDLLFKRVADDAPYDLRQFEGKVVVLNLWATYCPPCIEEMPALARLQKDYAARGLVVIALSDESREKLQAFFRRRPLELLCGYTASFGWLNPESFRPFTLIIDRQGTLRKHFFGKSSYEDLEAHIRPFL
jgi:cytochrome c biogenesis protein CcmG, thiol:disulfide interchange protein DsbE